MKMSWCCEKIKEMFDKRIIDYTAVDRIFLLIEDEYGEMEYNRIQYCPFCGKKLYENISQIHRITIEEAKQEVDKGWHEILDKLYNLIPPDVHVTNIKEKFGGLRIEIIGASIEIHEQIEALEEESFSYCEICGRMGR